MARLKEYGNIIIEPASGFLASGLEGKGRMEEPEVIVDYIDQYFDLLDGMKDGNKEGMKDCIKGKDLMGKRILITAGPTYEKIDPVRFIGNYSSGKMGFA